ncbi:MAG: aminoacyl-tRNA hydrolase [Candidatus Absconditicoccaceae bacterium]
MKLVVGLGNPGGQYANTRHNVGFLMIDKLQNNEGKSLGELFTYDNKFGGEVVQTIFGGQKVIFLKPMEFMNRSGGAVSQISNFYKIESKDILVIHDDIDLGVGTIKFKLGGGAAGHNGIRDIMEKIGDQEFYRIRIGIDRPENSDYVAEYVLSNFKKEEIENIVGKFDEIEDFVKEFLNK